MPTRRKSPRSANGPFTLEGERDAILALLSEGAASHWRMGVHYNNIVDNKLIEHSGKYHKAHDFFEAEIKAVSQATLSIYGAVARSFSEEHTRLYGVTKLNLLLTHAHLVSSPKIVDPGTKQIFVPRKDGSAPPKLFRDCTRAEMLAAIRRIQGKYPRKLPPGHLRQVKEITTTIERALGPDSGIAVSALHNGHETRLTFKNVRLQDLAALISALGRP